MTLLTVVMVGLLRPAAGGDVAVALPEVAPLPPAPTTEAIRAVESTMLVLPAAAPMIAPEAVQALVD